MFSITASIDINVLLSRSTWSSKNVLNLIAAFEEFQNSPTPLKASDVTLVSPTHNLHVQLRKVTFRCHCLETRKWRV